MMKLIQVHYIAIVFALLLIGCGNDSNNNTNNATTVPSGTNNVSTTVQCREIKPILLTLEKRYVSYKDSHESDEDKDKESNDSGEDEESSDSGGSHNEGRNCLVCHNFASAGTVFNNLHAANNTPGAAGYRIKLSTGIVYGNARGTGNSKSSSFPSTNFTAQVIDPNGNIVNSSADMSHDASRRACNSCHSSSGNSGAPGRITSSRFTSSVPVTTNASNCVSFNSNVLPLLTAKCKTCHGSNGNFTITTANGTYANIAGLRGSASAGATYLLNKATNTIGHGGGQVISTSSAEYRTLKTWIDEGASNN